MLAIILAAGRGTRLAPLTNTIPKPLVSVHGKTLLDHLLHALPPAVDDICIVVKYRHEQIRQHVARMYPSVPIRFIVQDDSLPGTAGALWGARAVCEASAQPFLVLQSDDMFAPHDILTISQHARAMGVWKSPNPMPPFLNIAQSANNLLTTFTATPQSGTHTIATGAYMLEPSIFLQEPHHLPSGELSLPRTLLAWSAQNPVRAVPMPSWRSVNTPEDLRAVCELRGL
ncbi:MAG: nucleotidyltransferase family protein [Patescibacteria group bacterium]